jgi:hypothetical protein
MPSYEGQLDEAALLKLIAEIKSMSNPKKETPKKAPD